MISATSTSVSAGMPLAHIDGEALPKLAPSQSVAGTVPVVTGQATAVVHNDNGSDGTDRGPVVINGHPFGCAALDGIAVAHLVDE